MPRKIRDLITERGSHNRVFDDKTAAIFLAKCADSAGRTANLNCRARLADSLLLSRGGEC